MLRNLITPELQIINAEILSDPVLKAQFPKGVLDPCPLYAETMFQFLDWVILCRGRNMKLSDVNNLALLGSRLRKKLRKVFPQKAGQDNAWNFMKFHAIRHMAANVIKYGCLENVSTNSGEHAHIYAVKNIAHNTNRRGDWESQIMQVHSRREATRNLLRECSGKSLFCAVLCCFVLFCAVL
jgi:hypothetical protein